MKTPDKAVYRFLDTDGDGTGTKNANGDYSSVADTFLYTCDKPGVEIARLIVDVGDTTGMQTQDYGNITNGLTNGFTIAVHDPSDNEILDLCDGEVIQTNGDWHRFCYDANIFAEGAGDEVFGARWTFAKAGQGLYLPRNWSIRVTLNDDLTGLLSHYFMLQGYEA